MVRFRNFQKEFKVLNLINGYRTRGHLADKEFVLKTQQQIARDFSKFNLTFDQEFEESAYEKERIEAMVAQRISQLMTEGESRLLQLLYTIDLSEKEFLVLTAEPNFIQLLAEKILFREAYKVFLRSKFS
jgi:2-oxoglutarate dehydrogenase complex dehydrogenase (E1) component-like enzyme